MPTIGGTSELERILRYLYDQVELLKSGNGLATGLAGQAGSALYVVENFVFGGPGGLVLPVGRHGGLRWKGSGTILGWLLFADVTGSVTIDVRKAAWGVYPNVTSICGGSFPTLSSQITNQSSSVSTWTTTLVDGDWLEFWITGTSVTNITELTIALDIVR